jgi:hypothetical protein
LAGSSLYTEAAVACKSRLYPETFPVEELADYANVYVVHVQKVVLSRPQEESWYAPPFTFEAKILKTLNGSKKPGALISGETSSGVEPAARCPIFLEAGGDFLLMMNGQKSPFVLPRYGSLYLSSDDEHFRGYVADIGRYYAARYKHSVTWVPHQ